MITRWVVNHNGTEDWDPLPVRATRGPDGTALFAVEGDAVAFAAAHAAEVRAWLAGPGIGLEADEIAAAMRDVPVQVIRRREQDGGVLVLEVVHEVLDGRAQVATTAGRYEFAVTRLSEPEQRRCYGCGCTFLTAMPRGASKWRNLCGSCVQDEI